MDVSTMAMLSISCNCFKNFCSNLNNLDIQLLYLKVKKLLLPLPMQSLHAFVFFFLISWSPVSEASHSIRQDETSDPTYKSLMEDGQYTKALDQALLYLGSFPPHAYSNEIAEVHKDIGYIYTELGNYVKAVEFYMQAVDMLQNFPAADLSMLALAHNDLAYSLEMIGNSIEGMYHYERAFELW